MLNHHDPPALGFGRNTPGLREKPQHRGGQDRAPPVFSSNHKCLMSQSTSHKKTAFHAREGFQMFR